MWLSYDILVLFSLSLSLIVVVVSVPSIVTIAHLKHLYDFSDRGKNYDQNIPNLGGIAIFAGLVVGTGLCVNISESKELMQVLVAMLVIFYIGIKDDILVIAPAKKLFGIILSAIIVVILADIRFTSLHGFMGIYEIDYVASIILTGFVVVVLINAFNLIDGIDGLASGIGIVVSLTFGIWFFLTGHSNYAILSAAICGSLFAFFGFNVFGKKNKIFMGNSGSLVLGLIISVLVIKFNEFNISYNGLYTVSSAPAVSFGILIVPVFDTLRVFIIRLLHWRSLFLTDRDHLYHRVLELGLSQVGSTLVILIVNILFIFIMLMCQTAGLILLMILNLSLALFFSIITEILVRRHKQHS